MEHIGHHLRDIYFNKKSGRLVFKQKSVQKYLFFQEGLLVYAKTTHPHELIGEILYKRGKISSEIYSNIDEYIEPMKSIGACLVENEILSKKELHDCLMYQMREITLNIFPHFDGKFDFKEKNVDAQEEFELKMNTPDLIEEGIRRMNYNPYMEKFMQKKIPYAQGEDFLDRLTKKEKEILDKLDGSASAEAFLLSAGIRPEFFWKSLYLFYCLDLVDVKDRKGKEKIPEKREKPQKTAEVEKKKPKKATEEEKKKEKKSAVADKEVVKKSAADEKKRKIAEVVKMNDYLSETDYYQILNISQSASQNEIKKAYFQLVRNYHPDRFPRNLPSDIKTKIENVFDYITQAFQTLSNEKKKLVYDAKKDTPSELDKKEIEKKAEMKYRHGKSLFHQEKYDEALMFLEEAVRLRSNKASYFLLLGKVESKIPSFHEKAEEDLKKAIEIEPWNAENYLGLGKYYKQEGLMVKARRHIKKALDIDPEHKGALKALEIEEEPKKKGIKRMLSFEGFGKTKKKPTKKKKKS